MNEHERSLAEYILDLAYEYGVDRDHVRDEIDWEHSDLEIDDIKRIEVDGDPAFFVSATTEGTKSRKVTSARKNPPGKAHPAEYVNIKIPVNASIWWFPSRFGTQEEINYVVNNQ